MITRLFTIGPRRSTVQCTEPLNYEIGQRANKELAADSTNSLSLGRRASASILHQSLTSIDYVGVRILNSMPGMHLYFENVSKISVYSIFLF